ncbi:PH domain-containing protein [Flexibacter flexilis DSM 6793]|uniref:PH domain-containing protein n=1 Tax=Flexibacter flexilis DSM 6793 TaxID=927664 RepID=A0A1I1F312_9BACT|nr:PH domain-containing protein [Flexibacter flexilis]SFB93775.1 PH domain-containing protein [Flexibacter flexilis DSM 6793]
MFYKASMDTLAKWLTGVVFVVLGSSIIMVGWFFVNKSVSEALALLGITFFLIFVFFVTWLYAPQGYILDKKTLTVKGVLNPKTIALADIKEVSVIPDQTKLLAIRVFGVGGFFGYFGYFSSGLIGTFLMYATQNKNRILITTRKDKKIMITPDNLQLADALKQQLAQ